MNIITFVNWNTRIKFNSIVKKYFFKSIYFILWELKHWIVFFFNCVLVFVYRWPILRLLNCSESMIVMQNWKVIILVIKLYSEKYSLNHFYLIFKNVFLAKFLSQYFYLRKLTKNMFFGCSIYYSYPCLHAVL